jgi:hypothetical protein
LAGLNITTFRSDPQKPYLHYVPWEYKKFRKIIKRVRIDTIKAHT